MRFRTINQSAERYHHYRQDEALLEKIYREGAEKLELKPKQR